MDLSSVMTTLLSSDSVKNLSKKTGSSQKDVSSVLSSALPLLLAGAGSQTEDESTAEGFEKALAQHGEKDTSNLASFLDGVDMEDGAKIIGHLLGANTTSTTKQVSQESGTDADSTAQILAAAAPLLMSLLGQETKKSKKADTSALVGALVGEVIKNVDVGSLLTGLLSVKAEEEEEKTAKKTTTTKKKTTTAAKSTTTKKKTTAAAKSTTTKKKAASTTTKKKAASTTKKTATKKKAATDNDGIDIGDVANLLTKILK
ncbi:MAG: DUF937 domain-containing protein [Oscillospiraceae bacterium]|nr:DUF937 domain-containing protein [Oscillospiraceae bacterium]